MFVATMGLWQVVSTYGIPLPIISRVSFLLELVLNWSPDAFHDVAVCNYISCPIFIIILTSYIGRHAKLQHHCTIFLKWPHTLQTQHPSVLTKLHFL